MKLVKRLLQRTQKFLTGSKDKPREIILLFKRKTLTYYLGVLHFLGLMPFMPILGHSRPNTDHPGEGEADAQ